MTSTRPTYFQNSRHPGSSHRLGRMPTIQEMESFSSTKTMPTPSSSSVDKYQYRASMKSKVGSGQDIDRNGRRRSSGGKELPYTRWAAQTFIHLFNVEKILEMNHQCLLCGIDSSDQLFDQTNENSMSGNDEPHQAFPHTDSDDSSKPGLNLYMNDGGNEIRAL